MKAGGHFGFKAFGFVCGLADYLQVSELSSCSFSCHSKRMVCPPHLIVVSWGVRNYDHENKNTIFVYRAGASRWRSFNHGASDESGHCPGTGRTISALLAGQHDELRVADDHESGHAELGDGEQCGDGQCRDGDELGPGGLFPVTGHDEHDGGHGADSGGFVYNGQLPFL